jgi:hypothetical protein
MLRIIPALALILLPAGCGGATILRAQPLEVRPFPSSGSDYIVGFLDGQQRQAARVFVRVSPASGGFVNILVEIPSRRDELGDGYRLEEMTLEFESDRNLWLWLEPKLGLQSTKFEPYSAGAVHGVQLHANFSEPVSQGTVNYRFILGPEYFYPSACDPERPLNFRASLVTRHGVAQTEFELELPQPDHEGSE